MSVYIFVIALSFAIAFAIHHLLNARHAPAVATKVPGWPILGNTLSIGSQGAAYIHRCRAQVSAPRTLRCPPTAHIARHHV